MRREKHVFADVDIWTRNLTSTKAFTSVVKLIMMMYWNVGLYKLVILDLGKDFHRILVDDLGKDETYGTLKA